ncbi:MAG: ABC transporter ATP-binding protein [Thermodesulfobacteriota bacterium]
MNKEFLRVEGLCKDFGGLRALDDLSFDVRQGEIFSIIGPNGSGKTTLFNIITGFLPPTRGKVFFKGEEISHLKPFAITQKGIARTFQITSIFARETVLDNIKIGHRLRLKASLLSTIFNTEQFRREEIGCQKIAEEIIEFIGLGDEIKTIAGNLTQEAQKRLSIGMALVTQPELLLLDEPTGGVNLKEISNLISLIEKIREKKITVILIEHKMKVAMDLPDRVMVLSYGQKIAEGKPEEIGRDQRVIEAYLGKSYAP